MDSLVAADLVAAASAGSEASREYDCSATEGAAMVAARAAGERALNDGATAESALAAAAAARRTVPLVEDGSTAAGRGDYCGSPDCGMPCHEAGGCALHRWVWIAQGSLRG